MPVRPLAALIETDAVVIGAGPVGLFQVFQLGLLEIEAHVVDALPYPGGQCVELYGDKPIYDIPSVQVCTGRELAERLLGQIAPFDAPMHLGEVVTALERQSDGRFLLQTRGVARPQASAFLCKTVFIAAGVGAFEPRKLKVEGLERFEGEQLFYRADMDAADLAGKHLVVLGGDEGAVDAAVRFAALEAAHAAASVTLLHRRSVLDAPAALLARFEALKVAGRLRLLVGQISGINAAGDRLEALRVTDPDARAHAVPVDALFVLLGVSPKLGPVADWGLALERKQLVVDTETYSTSEPGIFAVGDVNTYPGKKKLIVCGFHEATLAAWGAVAIVHPDRKTALQYTTTSPRLHRLLGVRAGDDVA